MLTEEKHQEWASSIIYADWYFNYSDDYNCYLRGQAQIKSLYDKAASEEWSDADVEEIFNQIVKKVEGNDFTKPEQALVVFRQRLMALRSRNLK